jgi:hypothetical protein
VITRVKEYLAKRKAERPERVQKRAAAKALRLEQRRNTNGPIGGGGG